MRTPWIPGFRGDDEPVVGGGRGLSLKRTVIGAGFAAMRATGLHKALAAPGRGVIFALHRVRRFAPPTPGYAPNRLLEVTPEFLDAALARIAQRFEFVTLAEAARRLSQDGPPFAALTFDDGYRDTRDVALPILQRHGAPATVFVSPGLIERSARLWWLELEEAIRRLDAVELVGLPRLPASTPREKSAAFERVYWALRARPEAELLDAVAALAAQAGVTSAALAQDEFLTWDEARAFARHPLIEIGAHSLSHRRLAQWPAEVARQELQGCKAALQAQLGVEVASFAYPVGDPSSAGRREFALAAEAGYRIAVTTRPGMVFPEHAAHLLALPRVSLNGLWQDLGYLDVLMSGAPFRLWNRGRRLSVA